MLQGDGSLHVGSAVVNVPSNRQQPVMDRPCARVVSRLACFDHLQERLWSDVAVPYQHTIDVKAGVQQVLIVAGEDREFRVFLLDNRDLHVPSAHVANTILHGNHTWLCSDIQQSFQVVGSLGVVWVLEQNEG